MRGLVNGLQNRVHPFESGTDLKLTVEAYLSSKMCFFVFMYAGIHYPILLQLIVTGQLLYVKQP